MLSIYPACFFKEENGYSVIFPDLDVATCGETMDEAMAMAVDCLAGRLRWLEKDGEPIPEPSPMNSIDLAAISKELEIEPEEAFVNMISVDVEAYAKEHFDKSVRKTLTIPAWLNTAALEMDINFSQVLQEALLAKVQAR
ncbi:MAG: type II toxin-antitoxin system HicB family antitoxin [Lachnospiraceae bacterium]|nr:type II toxin-antitoxin system HicB family antitoxin [Lachnospiraceae bacterium]